MNVPIGEVYAKTNFCLCPITGQTWPSPEIVWANPVDIIRFNNRKDALCFFIEKNFRQLFLHDFLICVFEYEGDKCITAISRDFLTHKNQ